MPGHGGEYHDYLKKESVKKIAEVFGKNVRVIKNEQLSDGKELANMIRMNIGIIIPGYNPITPTPVIYPDIAVMVKMEEEEKIYISEELSKETSIIDKSYIHDIDTKLIFVECETATSPLTRGEDTNKVLVYRIIKNNLYPLVNIICATFDNVSVDSDIFINTWRFEKPKLYIKENDIETRQKDGKKKNKKKNNSDINSYTLSDNNNMV